MKRVSGTLGWRQFAPKFTREVPTILVQVTSFAVQIVSNPLVLDTEGREAFFLILELRQSRFMESTTVHHVAFQK